MSKWISGKDLLERLNVMDFELFNECVRKGLQPYDDLGRPVSPSDVMKKIFDVRPLKDELADHERFNKQMLDEEEAHFRADRTIALGKEIDDRERNLMAVKEVSWNEFLLPNEPERSKAVLARLTGCLFRQDDVEEFEKGFSLEVKAEAQKPSKPTQTKRKLRPVQRHKIECRAVAERRWKEDPSITIAGLIMDDEINQLFEGKNYAEDTIRNWIKDLCPDRSPGRRTKKKSG